MKVIAALLGLGLAAAPARADVDYFKAAQARKDVPPPQATPPRTTGERLVIGGLLAGSLIAAGVGAEFNLGARDAADSVSAKSLTGKTWTPDLQATYDRIHTDNVRAGIAYGVAGAFAIATLVALWETEKEPGEVELHPTSGTALVAPVRGGAIVGASWTW